MGYSPWDCKELNTIEQLTLRAMTYFTVNVTGFLCLGGISYF